MRRLYCVRSKGGVGGYNNLIVSPYEHFNDRKMIFFLISFKIKPSKLLIYLAIIIFVMKLARMQSLDNEMLQP